VHRITFFLTKSDISDFAYLKQIYYHSSFQDLEIANFTFTSSQNLEPSQCRKCLSSFKTYGSGEMVTS